MRKMLSLIKASMSNNMSLFKIKTRKNTKMSKLLLPIILTILIFFTIWNYANMIIEPLNKVNLEFVLLTLFVCFVSIMTLVEGIYKSSSLLFNCKDDDLLLSLPIKKSTVLFVRILKFYVFELIYNSLFLLPAMVVYIRYVNVDITYYLVSFIAILLLPIVPIVISCIIGGFISLTSSKFKFKNIVQIFITTLILLVVMYASFNFENIIQKISQNALHINEIVTKIYYPAGAYINLVLNFSIYDLLIFIGIHIALFAITIIALSKVYFKINSNVKAIKIGTKNSKYKIKAKKPMRSLIKKELNRFINSPVFVINAGFGLVLFLVGCIIISIKYDTLISMLAEQGLEISKQQINSYLPVISFGLICFASLMSSITSSMISLEGKSFNILKSLPVSKFKIITSKVLTAVLIMIPFIFAGDLVLFIRFKFSILQVLILLISSIILPLVSETIGIIVNLKYPKMDAENDTEIVKQSMSSMASVLTGMILLAATIYGLVKCVNINISSNLIILCGMIIYIVIYLALLVYLNKRSIKDFDDINV